MADMAKFLPEGVWQIADRTGRSYHSSVELPNGSSWPAPPQGGPPSLRVRKRSGWLAGRTVRMTAVGTELPLCTVDRGTGLGRDLQLPDLR